MHGGGFWLLFLDNTASLDSFHYRQIRPPKAGKQEWKCIILLLTNRFPIKPEITVSRVCHAQHPGELIGHPGSSIKGCWAKSKHPSIGANARNKACPTPVIVNLFNIARPFDGAQEPIICHARLRSTSVRLSRNKKKHTCLDSKELLKLEVSKLKKKENRYAVQKYNILTTSQEIPRYDFERIVKNIQEISG